MAIEAVQSRMRAAFPPEADGETIRAIRDGVALADDVIASAFDFTIIAAGVDPYASGFEDRLFEAGCDDATISLQKGAIILEFHRAAKNFSHAVDSAIADVEKAGLELRHYPAALSLDASGRVFLRL